MLIAAQLYTVRDFTKTAEGLDETLEKIAAIGYPAVQLSAVGAMDGPQPEIDFGAAKAMLEKYSLQCVATHRPWGRLVAHIEDEIADSQLIGCDYIAIGSATGDFGAGPDALVAFAEAAKPIVERLAKSGIRFGYHNHDGEFERIPGTRSTGFDRLMEVADPRMEFEIDTYWVQNAGLDPAWLLRRCAGRIAMVHLKDKEIVRGAGPAMAPVGEGNLDWDSILGACLEGGTESCIVEQDTCRSDPFDCLASSFEFVSERLAAIS